MINYSKKMPQLRYKDLILQMYRDKKSIVEITKSINFRLSRTIQKVKLSETTIRNLIKRYKDIV